MPDRSPKINHWLWSTSGKQNRRRPVDSRLHFRKKQIVGRSSARAWRSERIDCGRQGKRPRRTGDGAVLDPGNFIPAAMRPDASPLASANARGSYNNIRQARRMLRFDHRSIRSAPELFTGYLRDDNGARGNADLVASPIRAWASMLGAVNSGSDGQQSSLSQGRVFRPAA